MRRTRWDSFRWFLLIMFLFQCWYVYHEACLIRENLRMLRVYRSAKAFARNSFGDYVYLFGDPIPIKEIVENKEFDAALCERMSWKAPLWYEAVYSHTVRRGKSSRTVTDRSYSGRRIYKVNVSGVAVIPSRYPDLLFSPHKKRLPLTDNLSKFSPVSQRLEVTYFTPTTIYLFGMTADGKDGTVKLEGDKTRPLIASELSRDTLTANTTLAVILAVAAIVYFLLSVIIPWKRLIRKQLEQMPSIYFIFDTTGGPEGTAILLIILYAVIFAVVRTYLGSDHQIYNEQMESLAFLGFCMLLHVSHSVEFMYVADKRDGYIYEYSRGFFTFNKKKLGRIGYFRVWIEVHRGSKGRKSYYLKASGPDGQEYYFSDGTSSEDALIIVQNEFYKFRNDLIPKNFDGSQF